MLQAIGLPVVLQALRDAGGQLHSGRILDATAVAAQAATEQQGKGQAEYGFHGVLRWGIERCIITARLWARQTFAAGGRSGLPAAAKRRRYWPHQAAWLLGPPSGVVTGSAKRRGYWLRQAAYTGSAKRCRYRVLPLSCVIPTPPQAGRLPLSLTPYPYVSRIRPTRPAHT